jgi:hypothetical protein
VPISGTPLVTQYFDPIPPGARIYTSQQGDWWDLISLRVYGMRRGDDHLMHRLIEANYHLREVSKFPAGVGVIVPPQPVKLEIPLVPWKKASIVTPT